MTTVCSGCVTKCGETWLLFHQLGGCGRRLAWVTQKTLTLPPFPLKEKVVSQHLRFFKIVSFGWLVGFIFFKSLTWSFKHTYCRYVFTYNLKSEFNKD